MKLKRKYVAVATVIVIASFMLGTAVLAAPKNPKGKLPKPDYDSGWVSAYMGTEETITFTHNLGSRDLFVYIYYMMSDPNPPIPGEYTWTHNYVSEEEVHWIAGNLNEIVVYFNTDSSDYWLQQMRVLIWKIPN